LTLYRYRSEVLYLNSVLSLTRGNPAGPLAMLPQLRPESGSFTGVVPSENGKPSLIGQMFYASGERSAHLAFMAPVNASQSTSLPALFEGLASQAGAWGAFNLLAEVEELAPIFENLRRSGFCVFAWQRIWQLPPLGSGEGRPPNHWKPASPADEFAIRSLYQSLVPPLVQSAEPLSAHTPQGLVYHQDGEVLAYAEGIRGSRGIYFQPLIHPGTDCVRDLLDDLPYALPIHFFSRPVYMAIRSYHAWLESTMEEMGARVTPRQALLVKHLMSAQRVPATNKLLGVLEQHQAEPTAPMINNFSESKK
jgi:hypothetical protein